MDSKARVLIVEDEAIIAEDLKLSLLGMGYAIPAVVHSGEEAITVARDARPDVVLMDVMLSGFMDGIDTASAIKAVLDVPVIYLTSCVDEAVFRRAKTTDPFSYLVKPFSLTQLYHHIEMALHKHSLEREIQSTLDFLSIINRSGTAGELLSSSMEFLARLSGCSRIGIRQRNGTDFPYSASLGFSEDFLKAENSLITLSDGRLHRDGTGELECMCGCVLTGRADPRQPYFTENGSFWTGSTTELLAERPAVGTRNRCHYDGFETVALVPLHAGGEIIGLVHFADRKRGRLTQRMVDILERLVDHLAIALSQQSSEQSLRQVEEKTRALLSALPDLILLCRRGGTILGLHSPEGLELSLSVDNPVGRRINEVFDAEMAELFSSRIEQWLSVDQAHECFSLSIGGQPKYFEARSVRCANDEVLTIVRDITERKRADDEIAQYLYMLEESRDKIEEQAHELALMAKERAAARDLAEAANRAKSDFLATMSHEIRTPMNSIIGLTEMLQKNGLTKGQRTYADSILGAANILLEIIDEILDISRIEAGKLSFEPVEFDLRGVCEEVTECLLPKSVAKDLELILDYPRLVPSRLTGDMGKIRQVILNLAGNAIKFTRQGCVIIEVACLEDREDDALLAISVRDTGTGIPEEKLPLLFQKFSQLDTSSCGNVGGAGLGLAICKNLVQMMGGEIGVESTLGEGSTFRFTLSLQKAKTLQETVQAPSQLAGKRVLIVDDLEINRSIFTEFLSNAGMRCSSAATGAAALEMMRSAQGENDPYCIVLIDRVMSDTDGIDLGWAITEDETLDKSALVLLSPYAGGDRDPLAIPDRVFAAIQPKPIGLQRLYDTLAPLSTDRRAVHPKPKVVCGEPVVTSECFSGLRVLVAEDSPSNQMVATAMLKYVGCWTDVVSNGNEAVEILRRSRYDIVLMDCAMPVMNGFEATAEIRRMEGDARHTVIIALTANAIKGFKEKCLAAGMDDYLSKPIRTGELTAILDRWGGMGRKKLPPESTDEAIDVLPPTCGGEVDATRLRELARMYRKTGRDFFPAMIDPFLRSVEESIPGLLAAIEQGHADHIFETAHKLKGGSGNLGMRNMTRIFTELLNHNQLEDGQKALVLVRSLGQEIPIVRQKVSDLRALGQL